VADLYAESEKVFRLMRYSNIVEFEHKTIVPPPFSLIEFLVRIGLVVYRFALKILHKDYDENTNFVIKYMDEDQELDLNEFEIMKRDEFLNIEKYEKIREK